VDTDYNTGYFEAAFRFMPKLTLSGGLRWDHITNSLLTFSTNTTNRVSFHPVTGRYALTYQLRPNVTLYLGRSHAIQPAGTGVNSLGATALVGINQTQAQFTTQPSRGWEGGVKASAWRERIQGTLSYFQVRKYNIITQELVDNVTVLERAGKSKAEGIDTQFMVTPIRMFSLQGDFVWNNGSFLVFHSVANGAEIDRSGNRLPRVPAAQWSVTPIVRFGPLTANMSFRTRGASWSDNNNTQRLPPLTVLNANIGIQMARGVIATLTARNLTDELVMNRGGIVSGATTGRFGLPRNYSVQITKSWPEE
jgi:iron complex outermembrane receptor protein